jgi:hypothetical protein
MFEPAPITAVATMAEVCVVQYSVGELWSMIFFPRLEADIYTLLVPVGTRPRKQADGGGKKAGAVKSFHGRPDDDPYRHRLQLNPEIPKDASALERGSALAGRPVLEGIDLAEFYRARSRRTTSRESKNAQQHTLQITVLIRLVLPRTSQPPSPRP